jgi:Tfp pilus assembly protein FimT
MILLFVIAIEALAIVANLALPWMQDHTMHARAATIASEMDAVRQASLKAYRRLSAWPAASPTGAIPAEVLANLPHGFSGAHSDHHLVWQHWTVADGHPLGLSDNEVVTVTAVTDDPRLAEMVAWELPRGLLRTSLADRTMLVIDEPVLPRR